ncbi:hypothetical protein PVL29_018365 [Vitis rotundifolia]|uniref:Uncharacterized protein n=1 Tax=Vitis rotundifolia TaxID=103349 RepID=A0AA39DFW1_VITRO|nr:hypothetical protein PVL29_018365 [Vitis rotundifolia]
MENLLLLLLSQQALVVQHQNQKCIIEVADGYLLLLDVCSVAKDALLQTKERVQELQSTLRRRQCGEQGAANEFGEYIASRKKVKKVEAATLTVLESLLSFIVVSRLIHSKRVESEEEKSEFNEFEKADATFQIHISQKTSKSFNIQAENVQNLLGNLELSIQDLDGGVESLFRRLIKTRVSLLNIFNH